MRRSKNFEIWSRDPGHAHLGSFYDLDALESVFYACADFQANSSDRSKVMMGPKISKFGHVTQATPT